MIFNDDEYSAELTFWMNDATLLVMGHPSVNYNYWRSKVMQALHGIEEP